MPGWREITRTDVFIRATGSVLLVVAFLSGSALLGSRAELAGHHPGALRYLLAAIAYLAGTAGAACLALGRHLFDRIEVARPWGSGDIAYLRPEKNEEG